MASLWLTLGDCRPRLHGDRGNAGGEPRRALQRSSSASGSSQFRLGRSGRAGPASVFAVVCSAGRSGRSVELDNERRCSSSPTTSPLGRFARDPRAKFLQVELAVATTDSRARLHLPRARCAFSWTRSTNDAGAMFALAALVVLEPADLAVRKLLADVSLRLGPRRSSRKSLDDCCRENDRRESTRFAPSRSSGGLQRAPARFAAARDRSLSAGARDRGTRPCDAPHRCTRAVDAASCGGSHRREVRGARASCRARDGSRVAGGRRSARFARIASSDFGDTERAIWRMASTPGLGGRRGRPRRYPPECGALSHRKAAGGSSRVSSSARLRRAPGLRRSLLVEAATISEGASSTTLAGRFVSSKSFLTHTPDELSVMERPRRALPAGRARHVELLALKRRQVDLAQSPADRVAHPARDRRGPSKRWETSHSASSLSKRI